MLGFNIDVLCVFACMCLILFILIHIWLFFFFKHLPGIYWKQLKWKKCKNPSIYVTTVISHISACNDLIVLTKTGWPFQHSLQLCKCRSEPLLLAKIYIIFADTWETIGQDIKRTDISQTSGTEVQLQEQGG